MSNAVMNTSFTDLLSRASDILNQCRCGNVNVHAAGTLIGMLTEMVAEHRHIPIVNRFFYDCYSIVAYSNGEIETAFDKSVQSMESPEWDEENIKRLRFNQHFSIPKIYERYSMYNPVEVGKMVELMCDTSTADQRPITLTMTSCKRFPLFQKTVNSFLNCCLDKHLIRKWIVVDDNSSKEDRIMMKKMYPFITYIWKKPEDKGHPRSMNLLRKKVKTPYYFHMEDDWCFFRKECYLTKCMNVLKEDPTYGQCLLNVYYSEAENVHELIGATMKLTSEKLRYYIHQFLTGKDLDEFVLKTQERHCVYWPHYSLRVGLNRTKLWEEIGEYNEKANHFEMEYAYRYVQKGYKTTFLDNIFCYHIGRKTFERDDKTKLNAYDLNQEVQFGEKNRLEQRTEGIRKEDIKPSSSIILPPAPPLLKENKTPSPPPLPKQQPSPPNALPPSNLPPPIKLTLDDDEKDSSLSPSSPPVVSCDEPRPAHLPKYDAKYNLTVQVVNLKRRSDRRKTFSEQNEHIAKFQYQFFDAVDGKELGLTQKICKLFETGDFNYRRGIVGCALSHIKLWAWLAFNPNINSLLVMEDDAIACPNFETRFAQVVDQLPPEQWDVLFLGHHLYPQFRTNEDRSTKKYPIIERWSKQKCEKYSMGGTAGYFISKRGAVNLLKHIMFNGVSHGIDWVMFKTADLLSIYYCYPHLVYSECHTTHDHPDSDIQYDHDRIPVTAESWFANDVEYWKKKLDTKTPHYILLPNTEMEFGEIKDCPQSPLVITNMIPDKDILLAKVTFIKIEKMPTPEIASLFQKLSQLPVKFYTILRSYIIVVSQTKMNRDIETEITFDGFMNPMCPVPIVS